MKHFIYLEAGNGDIFTHECTFADEEYIFPLYGWMNENYGADTLDQELIEWCKIAKIGDYFQHRLGVCVRVNQ